MAALTPPGQTPAAAAPANTSGTVKGTNPFTNNPVINKIPGHSVISTLADPGNLLAPTNVDLTGLNNAGNAATANAQQFNQLAAGTNIAAPTINTAQSDQTRGQQEQAIQALAAAANGTAPSAADIQAETARQANVANQLGLAAATQGSHSPGQALAQASMGTANINSQAAAAGAAQRAAEQQAAQNNLVAALGGVRGQDVTSATNQAQLQSTAAGQTANLQGQLYGDQATSTGQNITAQGDAATAAAANAKSGNSLTGGVLGGISSIISDERAKTGTRSAQADADQMLDALSPESFEYKDGIKHVAGAGRRIGVMAQDMERSRAGRAVVNDGPVKSLDTAKTLSASLAALAALNTRVRALEGGR